MIYLLFVSLTFPSENNKKNQKQLSQTVSDVSGGYENIRFYNGSSSVETKSKTQEFYQRFAARTIYYFSLRQRLLVEGFI